MSQQFQNLYLKAAQAGAIAADQCVPEPMYVCDGSVVYKVEQGVCGFAWVNVRPGNSPFANWLKKNKLAGKAYHGGVDIWVGGYGQCMAKKEAHAYAMAEVLREAGIKAYANSRLD